MKNFISTSVATIAKAVSTTESPAETQDMGTYRSPVGNLNTLNTPSPSAAAFPSTLSGTYGFTSAHTIAPLESAFPIGNIPN